jgi:phenolic acid decarboxylase
VWRREIFFILFFSVIIPFFTGFVSFLFYSTIKTNTFGYNLKTIFKLIFKMKKVSIVLLFAFAIIFSNCEREDIWEKQTIVDSVAETNTSGSGYRDLEGKFIDYQYIDFANFQLAFYDNKLTWYGYDGYFKDIIAQVEPQISKVNENIYFLSWLIPAGGGDNVVVNFDNNKVFAHLHQPSAERSTDFELIHGSIVCGPATDCDFPVEEKTTGTLKLIRLLNANIKEFDLPEMGTMDRPLIPEHTAARDELAGKVIKYTADNKVITVQVEGDLTKVTDETGTTKEFQTHVTKIGTGVYFISWLTNEEFGQHIVFNENTMQVFDQITEDGVSKEQIYTVSCFGSPDDCM